MIVSTEGYEISSPQLHLVLPDRTTFGSNDNWKTRSDGSSQQGEVEATGIPPTSEVESALVQTLAPGHYTTIMRGTGTMIGIAVVEAYTLQ